MEDVEKLLTDVIEAEKCSMITDTYFEESKVSVDEYNIASKRGFDASESFEETLKRVKTDRATHEFAIKTFEDILDRLKEEALSTEQLVANAWKVLLRRGNLKRMNSCIMYSKSGRIFNAYPPLKGDESRGLIVWLYSCENEITLELTWCEGIDNYALTCMFFQHFCEICPQFLRCNFKCSNKKTEDPVRAPPFTEDWMCTCVSSTELDLHKGNLRIHLVIHGINRCRGDPAVAAVVAADSDELGPVVEHDVWSAIFTVNDVSTTVRELKEIVEAAKDSGSLEFKNCAYFFQGIYDEYHYNTDDDEEILPLVALPKVLDLVEFHPETPTTEQGITEWDKQIKDFGSNNWFMIEAIDNLFFPLLHFHAYVVDGSKHVLM